MNKIDEQLLEKFNNLANGAYVPYSNFRVLAYFENKDGTFFKGINIENASYPNGGCAERVGIFSAINANIDLSNVKTIHIFSPDSSDFLSPCGGCRQTISEHFFHEIEIRMYSKNGEYISENFSNILPYKIDPKNIKGIK